MKTSEQINEIAAALAKAQGELSNVRKDTQGYGYQYATLDQIVDVARPVMAANNIAWLQDVSSAIVDGLVIAYLKTRLVHASGQWIESDTIALPIDGGGKLSTAQHFGGVSTYQRRYQLAPLLGIAAEADDDAAKKDEGAAARVQKALDDALKAGGREAAMDAWQALSEADRAAFGDARLKAFRAKLPPARTTPAKSEAA